MSNTPTEPETPRCRPLPWQLALCDYLRRHEPRAWEHFAAPAPGEKLVHAARLELLKAAHRIDRASWPEWYAAAEQTAAGLGLRAAVTLYQAQTPQGLGAALASIPGEAHLVLHGPAATKLPEPEFRALLAHELAALSLWQSRDGELLIAERVLGALSHAGDSQAAYGSSARRFALCGRLVRDRAALAVVGDLTAVIGMIARIEAARSPVAGSSAPTPAPLTAAAFLLRAEELLRMPTGGASLSAASREAYLRAWAINLWARQGGDPELDAVNAAVERALAEPTVLDGLDVVARQRVAETTRRMLSVLLAPSWFQTAAVLDQARLYFNNFHPAERTYEDVTLAEEMRGADASLRDYYCFVLLDFVSADRAIQHEAVRAALQLAQRLGWKERFAELLQEELGWKKKQLEKLSETPGPPVSK